MEFYSNIFQLNIPYNDTCTQSLEQKKGVTGDMKIKYIKYERKDVYAVIYRNIDLICYNINFIGETQLYLISKM
ncbi:MAG TPA: hypothetical protein DC053_03925 [Lachnoclostridium sp.]|nr:hypothetical protein [Lachnoclostridium sp.]